MGGIGEHDPMRDERSGYYLSRVEWLLDFLQSSECEAEAIVCRRYVTQYLDFLVSADARNRGAFLIICHLLKTPTVSPDICRWLKELTISASVSDTYDQETLVVGVFSPSLEPPLKWHEATETRRVNCLLSFLADTNSMWAPISAYAEHYDRKTIQHLQEDLSRLNWWRGQTGQPPLLVDWNAVALQLNKLFPELAE